MRIEEFKAFLERSGFPVAYESIDTLAGAAKLPYVVWRIEGEQHFGADYKKFFVRYNVSVELYTAKKDIAAEKKLDKLFDEYDFTKNSTYFHGDKINMTEYKMSICEEE